MILSATNMKDFFKHYFDGFFESDYPFWKVMTVVCPLAILLTCAINSCSKSYQENHPIKYDTYEICILDKYEDIGSSWHLVGGRSSETEYHIYYKYCNRTKNTRWEETTRTVDGTTYRKYKVGDRVNVKMSEDCYLTPRLP